MAKNTKFNQDKVKDVLETTSKVATGVASIVGTFAALAGTLKKK